MPGGTRAGRHRRRQLEAGGLADHAAERQADRHGRVVTAPAEGEGQQEREEADGRPEQAHGLAGQHHAAAAQLGLLVGPSGSGATCTRRQGRGGDGLAGGDDRGEQQHPLGTGDGEEQGARDGRREPAHAGQQRQLRVRLHQLGIGVHDGRDEGAAGDGVGLAQHEDQEGQREQQQAVEARAIGRHTTTRATR